LEALRKDVAPDRIVIETSGSAFPATLAMEVNRLARETGAYLLDGVISVIDVENWKGYEDTSYTAKVQAQYTDLIVLNKWELVSERKLEDCEDRIMDLAVDPPTPRTKSRKGFVDKQLVFGLDAALSKEISPKGHHGDADHTHDHQSEVEVLSVTLAAPGAHLVGIDAKKLHVLLSQATRDEVYRIKAVLLSSTAPRSSDEPEEQSSGERSAKRMRPAEPSTYILNWAFGRWTYTPIITDSARSTPLASGTSTPALSDEQPVLRMTIVTARYEANKWQKYIQDGGFVALADGAHGNLVVERTA
jgi:G3E family GTPase